MKMDMSMHTKIIENRSNSLMSSFIDGWDSSAAVAWALFGSILTTIGFIFMPWTGSNFINSGSGIFANTLYGTPGTIHSSLIWIVLVAITVSMASSLWGIFVPEYGATASAIACLAGLFSMVYYANAFTDPTLSAQGIGFWVTFVGCVGLIVQPLLGLHTINSSLQRINARLSRALPIKVNRSINFSLTPYYFLIPGLIIWFIWIIGPTLYTFYFSFTRWDFIDPPTWIGIDNYYRLLNRDRSFTLSLVNNLRWLAAFLVVPTTMGLGLALVFNNEIKGGKLFKVGFYFPLVLSLPVIGVVWAWIYNPRMGLINSILFMLGFSDAPGWLADRGLAIWCIIVAAVWRQVGYVMILYLAGLKNIDPQLIEAGVVDGADGWRLFRDIIFPLLKPVTVIIVVIAVIDSLRAFDLVSIMTRGGQDTEVLANHMYMETFNNYNMGYGAAIAVIVFLISLVFIGFYLLWMMREEMEY